MSLVEVLVVLSLIGVLVGLLLPAVQKTRDAASRSACQNNLRQVALTLHSFDAAHGRLPPRPVAPKAPPGPDAVLGWMALVLPQMGEEPLYRTAEAACAADPAPSHNPPHTPLTAVVRSYTCPADGRLTAPLTTSFGLTTTYTSYVGIAGAFFGRESVARPGLFGNVPGVRLSDATDGASQTLLLGERPSPTSLQAGWWYLGLYADGDGPSGPNHYLYLRGAVLFKGDPCLLAGRSLGPGRLDNPCDRYHLWSLHSGGANVAFADGAVRFLRNDADPLMPALASRAGGEAVELTD